MVGAQVHYEVWSRRKPASGWTLEMATEDRARALETAEEQLQSGMAAAIRVTKESLDPETREFASVTILNKGDTREIATRKAKEERHDPLCVSPSDLYTAHARETIGRLLEPWLNRHRVTPFELLHRADLLEKLEAAGMELQHAIQKIAVPEAQDRGMVVHEVMRHYHKLVETSIERVRKDEKRRALPDFDVEPFPKAAERLVGNPDRHYLLSAGVARLLSSAVTWSQKVDRLLDLADSAPASGPARILAFQVLETSLAEILGSRPGMVDLLGPDLDLGGSLAAITRLTASETVDLLVQHEPIVGRVMPALQGAAARLATWLVGEQFEVVRAALTQRILRELKSTKRLRPEDPIGEIDILRALAMSLTAAAGKRMPLEQVQEAFAERSRMLVRSDFVDVYLGSGRSALEDVQALLWLAENITGGANKRAASRWVSANVGALRFEKDARAGAGSPATRLATLAALQRGAARVGLLPEELSPIQAKLGEIGGLVEADARLIALLLRSPAAPVQKLSHLVRMAAGETAPLGAAADRARQEVVRLMRDPALRGEVARQPELLAKIRELLQAGGMAA